ncbi:MAG TPA: class D sortase [Thermoanaerobaculia bacterium]|nr:class D sortase [Thermoanaerobaculia bacterium]
MSRYPKDPLQKRQRLLLWLERLLLAVGLLCLSLVAYAVIDARWFAFREGRDFDRTLAAARRHPAAWAPAGRPPAAQTDRLETFRPAAPSPPPAAPLLDGSVIGRIDIPRLGLSDLVLEGTGARTLRRGVGHIPETALPRQAGNVGLAGHRDTAFRALQEIQPDDLITLQTADGVYPYMVDWTRIVAPEDVEVLESSSASQLTLVTCYPFSYIGSAPERFVVRAHLVGGQQAGGSGGPRSASPIRPPAAPHGRPGAPPPAGTGAVN